MLLYRTTWQSEQSIPVFGTDADICAVNYTQNIDVDVVDTSIRRTFIIIQFHCSTSSSRPVHLTDDSTLGP